MRLQLTSQQQAAYDLAYREASCVAEADGFFLTRCDSFYEGDINDAGAYNEWCVIFDGIDLASGDSAFVVRFPLCDGVLMNPNIEVVMVNKFAPATEMDPDIYLNTMDVGVRAAQAFAVRFASECSG